MSSITGVSLKIEVTSRFEYTNLLYQQGASSPLFLRGVWGHPVSENFCKALISDFQLIQGSKLSIKKQVFYLALSQILIY